MPVVDVPDKILLNGKVVIVTGGAMGMGRATALLLARRGARVVVSDIVDDGSHQTVAMIEQAGGEALAVHADIGEEEDVKALVDSALRRFGRLDAAVNNAAIGPDKTPISDIDMVQADRILRTNLRGMILCLKYELAAMLKQGTGGSIVNIGSVSSVRPFPGNNAYVAAKHGIVGLTKNAALENGVKGIRVNAVLPGAIYTPMVQTSMKNHNIDPDELVRSHNHFGRWGQPEEVAEGSAWLCSDAASFVTGHSLAIDGGFLAQ